MVATFFGTQKEVTVNVDDRSVVIKTHLDNVGAILRDSGVTVQPGDIVFPPPGASLSNDRAIKIKRSKPVVVRADGITYSFRTQGGPVAEAVREAGVDLRKEDAVYVSDRAVSQQADLAAVGIGDEGQPRPQMPRSRGGTREAFSLQTDEAKPIELTVERAVPIYVHDGQTTSETYTTRQVLGDALADYGTPIYEADLVFPRLGTQVAANMHVYILRAKPFTIKVDGRTIQSRTQAKTIEEAILHEGVKLVGKDRIEPPREAPVESNVLVRVTRVKEDVITEQEAIGYALENRPDPTIEIDERRVVQQGRPGVRKWQTRIVYENGEEISRTIERQWVETPPVNRVIGYGTKIVIRELDTPQGTLTYWRKFRMWATSYNASHGGKSRENPAYGLTRTGIRLARGIVAIDPNIIPFYTRVYVPGYGTGLAADTGGGIRGMMIDLAFEESDTDLWSSRWADVYFLTPVPPPDEINYRTLDR